MALAAVLLAGGVFIGASAPAQPAFDDVTAAAGITYVGPSFGVSWGDLNGDGYPDVWVGNHGELPEIYLNDRRGAFLPGPALQGFRGDNHGAAWADFDNDGDADLLVLNGAVSGTGDDPNRLLINEGAAGIREAAVAWGLDLREARGRTPLWFDWDNDGQLDVLLNNWKRADGLAPTSLFAQRAGRFVDVSGQAGLTTSQDNSFAQLGWYGLSGRPMIMLHGHVKPDRIFGLGSTRLDDLTGQVGFPAGLYPVRDSVLADLDGSPAADMEFLLMRARYVSAFDLQDGRLNVRLDFSGKEHGVSFAADGLVIFDLGPPWRAATDSIRVGSLGWRPGVTRFTLNPGDANNFGLYAHVPGQDTGIYVGYEPATQRWSLIASHSAWQNINAVISAQGAIRDVQGINFTPSLGAEQDRLFRQGPAGAGLVNVTASAGLDAISPCEAVAAADFDNDMDVDLYYVCRGLARDESNQLFENIGDGVFRLVPNAGGAAGLSGGFGDSVAAADYDLDGFIDLFATNGRGDPPFDMGPNQVFRNRGNGNHWLEFDLEGVQSNRDGVGAHLLITAGGVTQARMQNGGMHRFSQDHQRIHVGLGANTKADQVDVLWPSGIRQVVTGLPADQVVRLVEPVPVSVRGVTAYARGAESGVFVWQETFDGPLQIRTNGAGPTEVYELELLSSAPLSAAPLGLENNDTLQAGTHAAFLRSIVSSWDDGLEIRTAPAAVVTLAVRRNGAVNPRFTRFGASRRHASPAGWTLRPAALPPPPPFTGGRDLGLFVGREPGSGVVRLRWNGDGRSHLGETVLVSAAPATAVPVSFETGDTLAATDHHVTAAGWVSTWWDGLDVTVAADQPMALLYQQDRLFQFHRVNGGSFGLPDTVRVPRPQPYDEPVVNPATDAGLFVWKDAGGTWHVRATAGGGGQSYAGEIRSSAPLTAVAGTELEPNDVLGQLEPGRLRFALGVGGPWVDGFSFRAAPGAELSLAVDGGANRVRIGAERWPVEASPVSLSGW